ncbi:MAG: serpin family protein [Nocardioidaceae bacterium]
MISRRQALQSLLWAGAGVASGRLLTGCSGGDWSDRMRREGGVVMGGDVALSTVSRTAVGDAEVPLAVRAVQAFTADLYRTLAAGPGNLVCSPYSVAVALAMTRNGARGRTADEMDRVLHAPGPERFNAGMNALVQRLEDRAGTHRRLTGDESDLVLDSANSLWGQRDLRWEEPFLDVLARHYGAGMRLVDYIADPEHAAELINAWTSEATRERIPRLIPPGVLDHLTRLVLVNAIYFKAAWLEQFDKTATRRHPFTTSDGSRVEVDMMSEDLHRAAFASGEGWRAARLSYVGGELALAVVVPDADRSLGDVEASLDGPGLDRLLTRFRPVPVLRVEMPRWTFRVQARLNDHLIALGMPTAFTDRADFTGMTTQEQLCISHVLHEAFIAVDEAGTEAAAATAVVVRVVSAQVEPPLTLIADRPFLFVLFDIETATPIFIGRVSDPTQ